MTTKELNSKVAEFCVGKKKKIENKEWDVNELTILHIRDYLMGRGTIAVEDLDVPMYIAYIKGGLFKTNPAVIGFMLRDNKLVLAIHSREGLIKQHTNEGIINEIERVFKGFIQ